jgi:hypothetical protein
MPSPSPRLGSLVLLLAWLLVPGVAGAEDAQSLKQELEMMRQQFETVKREYEDRLRGLGERLRRFEAMEPAPAPPATPASGSPTSDPSVVQTAPQPGSASTGSTTLTQAPAGPEGPSLWEMLRPHQPFSLAQPGRVLLFDLGVAADFVADFTSNRAERLRDGTFNGRENRLFPRHIELIMAGRVDPYASAVVRFSAAEEPVGRNGRDVEVNVKLEEANGTLLALPIGTTARFGQMAPRFGTLNMVHEDDLPQVDRPHVLRRFFGQEEMNAEKGLEAFWILPAAFYQEFSLGVFNGDDEEAFGRGSLRDPLILSRLRSFFELGDLGGLQVDVSGGTGKTSENRRNTIGGLGLKYKWFPSVGYPFPLITVAAEGIYGNRGVAVTDSAGNASTRHRQRGGYYAYGQYDWSKYWAAGLRYDWTQLPTSNGHEWALSPYLQFKPSEFLRFRVQYTHTVGSGPSRDMDEVFVQGSFVIGAHPTERF